MVRGFVVALSLVLGLLVYLPSASARAFTCSLVPPLIPSLILSPSDEVQLQAACRSEALPAAEDLRLGLLKSIEIRTALEDTARLHNDLG